MKNTCPPPVIRGKAVPPTRGLADLLDGPSIAFCRATRGFELPASLKKT